MYAWMKKERGPGAKLVNNVRMPRIGSRDVLAKVVASSICGTDVHIWEWDDWAQQRIKRIPFIPGHEVAAEVVEVGKEVTSLQVGDLISAETHIVDFMDYQCRTGRMHVCQNMKILGVDIDGVFAEYFSLPEWNAWKNDPKLDPFLMSVQEPLGNSVHTLLPKGNVEDIAGKNIAIFGTGPTGLMAITAAKAFGAQQVIAVGGGSNRIRLDLARKMGADMVLSAKEEGDKLVKVITDATDGVGVDVVLEMSGAASALRQGLEVLTPGGRASVLGIYHRPFELDFTNLVVFKAAKIYGITGRLMFETWFQVKGLLRIPNFREKIAQVFTHRIPIRDVDKGMELLTSKQAGKVGLEIKWE
ncbi:MAG: zinc-binding dehydrogenase [Promethearchaeota archaeon]